MGEGSTMENTLVVTDSDGNEREITEKRHPDWEQLGDPCPECGATEYRHFKTESGRYGVHQGTVILRGDYGGTTRALMTQCRSCQEVLRQHPAFDLLYDSNSTQVR